MPLRKKPIAIQFQGGVSTKQDAKQVPATELLTLENATFIKQTTLAKRNGYRAFAKTVEGGGMDYGTPVGLANRDDELLLFTDDGRAYSYLSSRNTWADTGEVCSVPVSERPIARTGTEQTMPDHASKSGVTAVAWEDSRGGVYLSVVEQATGRILLAESVLDANGISPRCVAVGDVLHVYWARASANRLYVAIVNPAIPTATPTPSILISDLSSTNPVYDAQDAGGLYPSIAPAIMAWALNGGGYRVGYVHPSGVLGSPITGLPSAATYNDPVADVTTGPLAVCIDRPSGGVLYVAHCSTTVNVRTLDPTALLTSIGANAVSTLSGTWNRVAIESIGAPDGTSLAWWAGELDGARDDLNKIECGQIDEDTSITVDSTDRILLGHGLLSRAFLDTDDADAGGNVFVVVGHAPQYFTYGAVVRISGDDFGGDAVTACYARLATGQLPGLHSRKHVTSVQAVDPDDDGLSRQHVLCVGYRIQLASENGDQFGETGIKLATLDFEADAAYQSAQLGRGLYLAGACPTHYDGRRWAEADFHCAPDVATGATVLAQGAAGAVGAGTYEYKFGYIEIDAQGELHRGAVSVARNVTIIANRKIDVTLPTYRLTGKRHVMIAVYRTEQGATGDPDALEFFRVSSTDPTATGDNGYVLNDPSVDSITFTDNLTDADLITKEPLYTNGGILNNDPTPMSGTVIAGGKNRLFWPDATDANVIRYSQELAEETAVEMPAALFLPTDPYGGGAVGIGVLDDAVIVFKETAIYGFGGPGPLANPNAGQEAFSPAALITSDVGCKSANSICQSPVGLVFQSEKGIKLLDRSRQIVDIGSKVYAYNDQTITRATLLPDRHQIVFLTDAGATLLWDYERNQWSVFTNHLGIDARVVGGTYHYLRNDGRVFAETVGQYRDDNSQIVMRIETAWLKMLPYLQGWQRILWAYFLGTWKSAHTLVVRYRLDYDENYSPPFEPDVNANYDPSNYGDGNYGDGPYGGAFAATTRYQRRIHINRRCQAIQFRIEDREATADAGASFELSELLLIGGVLGPAFRPGESRTN